MNIYVEASSLTAPHLSGIGHSLLSTLRVWERKGDNIFLVIPFDKSSMLSALELPFQVKRVFLPDIIYRFLRKYNLFPWMDIFLGKGTYIFTNYWNWPLLFSKSATYFYDTAYLAEPNTIEEKNRRFLSNNAKKWIHRSDAIIAISEFTKQELVSRLGVRSEKISIVSMGVDSGYFLNRSNEDQVATIKKKYKLEEPYLLYVGNIEPRKNLLNLLAAYERCSQQGRTIPQLVIIGAGGWNNQNVLDRIKLLSNKGVRVHKLNEFVHDDELPALYKAAIATILVSTYEGFGITPLESLAVGTPVIVSDIPAIREVVKDVGIYIDPYNVEDISDKISRLIDGGYTSQLSIRQMKNRAKAMSWQNSARMLDLCINNLKQNV